MWTAQGAEFARRFLHALHALCAGGVMGALAEEPSPQANNLSSSVSTSSTRSSAGQSSRRRRIST